MKEKKPFLIELLVGIILAVTGLFVVKADYYATLFFAAGFGICLSSLIQLMKIYYYERPEQKERYENKKKREYINHVDERKIFLRMKAGSLIEEKKKWLSSYSLQAAIRDRTIANNQI